LVGGQHDRDQNPQKDIFFWTQSELLYQIYNNLP
jgi:hypothetical protein